ncbi:hypothetical protein EAE99_008600 [Botrytis elliptica]|nr:hypothetical protein EAE99_008600 [Botrytis elliptica]
MKRKLITLSHVSQAAIMPFKQKGNVWLITSTALDTIFAPPGAGNVSGKKRDGPAEGDCLGR